MEHPLINVLSNINEMGEEASIDTKTSSVPPVIWAAAVGLLGYALLRPSSKKELSEKNKEEILLMNDRLFSVSDIAETLGLEVKDVQTYIDSQGKFLQLTKRRRGLIRPSYQIQNPEETEHTPYKNPNFNIPRDLLEEYIATIYEMENARIYDRTDHKQYTFLDKKRRNLHDDILNFAGKTREDASFKLWLAVLVEDELEKIHKQENPKDFDEEIKKEIIEKYKGGIPTHRLGEEYNVDKVSKKLQAEVHALDKKLSTPEEIAKELSLKVDDVEKILKHTNPLEEKNEKLAASLGDSGNELMASIQKELVTTENLKRKRRSGTSSQGSYKGTRKARKNLSRGKNGRFKKGA